MSLFRFLNPAPVAEEINDAEVVKSQYRYWRWRIFLGMYVGYIFFYFTRRSLTFAMPMLMQELGLQISDLGILSSILSITYGLSKFLSGMLSDRSNPRFFMGMGLVLTGLFNIAFGMGSSVLFFAVFWGLNGWFQGWGWPPCAKLLTHWYSQRERGTWWGVTSTSQSVGGALIPFIAAFCVGCWGWRFAMYVPGVLCVAMGFLLMFWLSDTPRSLGLPSIEKFRNDYPTAKKENEEETLSLKEMLFKYVLTNKYVWLLGISYFFVYVIRQALNDFGVLFLVREKGYSMIAASGAVFWFEAGGILGSLVAGWSSDRLFKGMRIPVILLFCFGVISALFALYLTPPGALVLVYSWMFLLGIFIFGPLMLIGMAAVELSHKKAAGTANGFVGWLAYLGAATAGYPMSKITESFGWYGFFSALVVCGLTTVCLLTPLWRVRSSPKAVPSTEASS